MTGCMAQRYKQEIIDEIPEVDAVLGTTTYDSIIEARGSKLLGGEHMLKCEDIDRLVLTQCKAYADYWRTLCTSEDRGGLRQALYLLYYSEAAR